MIIIIITIINDSSTVAIPTITNIFSFVTTTTVIAFLTIMRWNDIYNHHTYYYSCECVCLPALLARFPLTFIFIYLQCRLKRNVFMLFITWSRVGDERRRRRRRGKKVHGWRNEITGWCNFQIELRVRQSQLYAYVWSKCVHVFVALGAMLSAQKYQEKKERKKNRNCNCVLFLAQHSIAQRAHTTQSIHTERVNTRKKTFVTFFFFIHSQYIKTYYFLHFMFCCMNTANGNNSKINK